LWNQVISSDFWIYSFDFTKECHQIIAGDFIFGIVTWEREMMKVEIV